MNLLKEQNQSLPTLRGLERTQTSLLLPVAPGVFFLTLPFIERGYKTTGAALVRNATYRDSRLNREYDFPLRMSLG